MIAGTPGRRTWSTTSPAPQLYAASQQFLAADQGIAEIARQKQLLARLKQDAAETAQLYRAMGYDVAGARAGRGRMARSAYDALAAGHRRPATLRRGRRQRHPRRRAARRRSIVGQRGGQAPSSSSSPPATTEPSRQLADANARLTALAAQRSTALPAVQAARGSDVALNQARLAESGQLGAQIERAVRSSWRSAATTVQGTGTFIHPLDGVITSPFGMRFHPILHYTKLHTGTDFAGGSVIHAADDGRVLMTVVSTAYGNFTVIDHGMVDGKHITTAYAHQARFLVKAGSAGQQGRPDRHRRGHRLRHRPAPALRGPRGRHRRRPDALPARRRRALPAGVGADRACREKPVQPYLAVQLTDAAHHVTVVLRAVRSR